MLYGPNSSSRYSSVKEAVCQTCIVKSVIFLLWKKQCVEMPSWAGCSRDLGVLTWLTKEVKEFLVSYCSHCALSNVECLHFYWERAFGPWKLPELQPWSCSTLLGVLWWMLITSIPTRFTEYAEVLNLTMLFKIVLHHWIRSGLSGQERSVCA